MIRFQLQTRYGGVRVRLDADDTDLAPRKLELEGPADACKLVRSWLSSAIGADGRRLGSLLTPQELLGLMSSFHARSFLAVRIGAEDKSAPLGRDQAK